MIERTAKREQAVIVGLINRSEGVTEQLLEEYLDELEFLADTAGVDVINRFVQKLDMPWICHIL